MKIEKSSQDEFLNALLSGTHQKASKIIFDLLNFNNPLQDIYEKIIKNAMYKIGDYWENGTLGISSEHLSSAIVQAIQNELYLNITSKIKNSKKIVLTCVENEQHQIGVKMVADIFEINGWNTYFLGAGLPAKDLIVFMRDVQPDLVALSATMHYNLVKMENMIQEIHKERPEITIFIGGQALQKGNYEHLLNNNKILYIKDLYSIDTYLTEL